MDLLLYLFVVVLGGLLVGALARLALPGRDPMSLVQTIVVGIGGSLAGGVIALAIFGDPATGGVVLSTLCASGIVYAIRRSRGGGLTSPGRTRRGER